MCWLLLISAGILAFAAWYFRPRTNVLRVLMYHKVSERHTDFLTVTARQLGEQLQYLRQQQYVLVSLADVLAHIETGNPLPRKSVLLTFDDGYANNITHAYPVLKQNNANAVIFIVPSFIGRTLLYDGTEQRFMNAEELLSMKGLIEYGWHSLKHDNYAQLSPAEILADLQASEELMTAFGISMQACLAYPYGAYPKRDKQARAALFDALKQAGIKAAFRIGNRFNALPLENRFLIQRLDIRGNESLTKFKRKIRYGKP